MKWMDGTPERPPEKDWVVTHTHTHFKEDPVEVGVA